MKNRIITFIMGIIVGALAGAFLGLFFGGALRPETGGIQGAWPVALTLACGGAAVGGFFGALGQRRQNNPPASNS
jgi:hypothetical protein